MQLEKVPIGIDLGTTTTVVYYKYNGVYHPLTYNSSNHFLPSVVQYRTSMTIGSSAVRALSSEDSYVLKNTKRVLGAQYDNINEKYRQSLCHMPMLKAADGSVSFSHFGKRKDETEDYEMTVTPIQVTTDILKFILKQAHIRTDKEVGKVTVTCPVSFKEENRLALKEAFIHAGIKEEDLRIINEPAATALTHSVDNGFKNGIVLVYDIGGGTFDTTVLEIKNGHFRVLANSGDSNIGGVFFDHIIMDKLLERIDNNFHKSPFPVNDLKKGARQKELFIRECEKMKELLSSEICYEFPLSGFANELGIDPTSDTSFILCFQSEIELCLDSILKKTLVIITDLLEKANLKRDDITTVLFTGGSCQLPFIKNMLNDYFQRDICGTTVYAKETVAKGACIVSDIWSANPFSDKLKYKDIIIEIEEITTTVIQNSNDWIRLSRIITEMVIAEGACNDMKEDLVIRDFDNLKSILVKKNAMNQVNSLKICDCEALESFVVEDGHKEENERWNSSFISVKQIELTRNDTNEYLIRSSSFYHI